MCKELETLLKRKNESTKIEERLDKYFNEVREKYGIPQGEIVEVFYEGKKYLVRFGCYDILILSGGETVSPFDYGKIVKFAIKTYLVNSTPDAERYERYTWLKALL